ncbi:lachrymatory-factor synthase-like [Amaranthus tricolor]|uniref:lachrymatory-factor synthase-like n=1 Tax=Amaranthus tricolor TaxID=29722 RepID=UPI0025871A27|nr:lachrymatory-factor synthase-like [Amaranthus tricolor]
MSAEEPILWEDEIIVELKTLTPQQVWPHFADFCSAHKLCPNVDNCYLVEGTPGVPGLIRCCESSIFSGGDVQFAKEKLLMIDPSNMCISYQVLENNVGFKYYVATIRLFPINGDDGRCRCKLVWSFVCDPVEGSTRESFCEAIKTMGLSLAQNLEENYSQIKAS